MVSISDDRVRQRLRFLADLAILGVADPKCELQPTTSSPFQIVHDSVSEEHLRSFLEGAMPLLAARGRDDLTHEIRRGLDDGPS